MEIGVGIETLDGSMVNPMVSWITSSSLGASLVDHLSTIRFHAILCLLFFSHPPPNPRISTGLWLGCFAARNHVWRDGRRRGEGQGISTFAWRIVRFSRLFQLSVWNARRDSWIHGRNVVEWMRIEREFIRECRRELSSSFYTLYTYIFWIFSRVKLVK